MWWKLSKWRNQKHLKSIPNDFLKAFTFDMLKYHNYYSLQKYGLAQRPDPLGTFTPFTQEYLFKIQLTFI